MVLVIKVTLQDMLFDKVLLDGGSGVNILPESVYLRMGLGKLEPAPFQVEMPDHKRVQPMGILRNSSIQIAGDNHSYVGKKSYTWQIRPLLAQSINLVAKVENDEEEAFLQANPTIVPIFEVDIEGILQKDQDFEEIVAKHVAGQEIQRSDILQLMDHTISSSSEEQIQQEEKDARDMVEKIYNKRKSKGAVSEKVSLTLGMVAQVFHLPFTSVKAAPRCFDEDLKKEFGPREGGRQYFMLKNVDYCRREQLKWFLERVCFLAKYDYMSRDNWAPLLFAEKGGKISWAHWVYETIHTKICTPDKRKTQCSSQLSAFLSAIFAFAQEVEAGEIFVSHITSMLEGTLRQEQGRLSDKSDMLLGKSNKLKTLQDLLDVGYYEQEAQQVLISPEHRLIKSVDAQTPSGVIGKTFSMPKKRKQDTSIHEVANYLDFFAAGTSSSSKVEVGIFDVSSAVKMLQALQGFVTNQQQQMEENLQTVTNSGVSKVLLQQQSELVEGLKSKLVEMKERHQKELQVQLQLHQQEVAKVKLSLGMFQEWTKDLESRVISELDQISIKNTELQDLKNQQLQKEVSPGSTLKKLVDVSIQILGVDEQTQKSSVPECAMEDSFQKNLLDVALTEAEDVPTVMDTEDALADVHVVLTANDAKASSVL
ncbi:hypothetical protein L7F22_050901 [Adiantum nelumboides]|nr:hypothetical protein [Adiantum nelumboides]